MMKVIEMYNRTSLIVRIICGLALGILFGLLFQNVRVLTLMGNVFVGALKAIAPVLVFALVTSSLAQGNHKLDSRFGLVIALYMISTLLASLFAVVASFIFPQSLILADAATAEAVPTGVGEVLENLVLNMVSNPVGAIANASYIGILFWAVVFGLAAKRFASDTTKKLMADLADILSAMVRWIINLAPFGIMGLVYGKGYLNTNRFTQVNFSQYCVKHLENTQVFPAVFSLP